MYKQTNINDQLTTIDEALAYVGDSHRYQFRIFILFCFCMATQAFQILGSTYLFVDPKCQSCDGQCTQYNNIITEFKLYCNHSNQITIAMSINFLGCIFGGTLMSFLGDLYGRRKIYILSWGIYMIGTIGVLASVNIGMYCFFSFLIGIGVVPTYFLALVILNEICGPQKRQKYSIGILIVWSFFEALTALIYYGIKEWRLAYSLFSTFPSILIFGATFYIRETPKFYISKGKKDQAIEQFDKIARINCKPYFSEYAQSNPVDFLELRNPSINSNKNHGFFDLFRYKSLRKASLGFVMVSFSLHVIYYGDQYGLNSVSQGRMIYLLGGALGAAELVGNIIIHFTIDRLQRRLALIVSYVVSIVSCGLFFFFGFSANSTNLNCTKICSGGINPDIYQQKEIFIILLVCLIRIFNTIGFAIQGLYANEFYPTPVRSIGTGFLYSCGILGSFLTPYLILFSERINVNPYFIIGGIGIIGPIGSLFIRETLNQPLENQIRELSEQK